MIISHFSVPPAPSCPAVLTFCGKVDLVLPELKGTNALIPGELLRMCGMKGHWLLLKPEEMGRL